MTDFSPATIEQRVMAAIRPTLEKADVLIDSYMPDKYRVIGKHHPEYDTFNGQIKHVRHMLLRLMESL